MINPYRTGDSFTIDLGTCTTGITNMTYPVGDYWPVYYPDYNQPDSTQYHYNYQYSTDPKLIELMTEMLKLMKEILKSKKRKKK